MVMGFWIFMLALNLLISITIIGFGRHFMKHPPKEINQIYGYRTSMSMKNKDTWEFAHHYFGNLWSALGIVMLVFSVIAMLFVLGKGNKAIGSIGGIICGVQVIFILGSIFFTEKALRENFDTSGNLIKR